ncbi:MAG: hypothetical protein ACFB3T_10305, partial [Geminicoccaceae bacterium]
HATRPEPDTALMKRPRVTRPGALVNARLRGSGIVAIALHGDAHLVGLEHLPVRAVTADRAFGIDAVDTVRRHRNGYRAGNALVPLIDIDVLGIADKGADFRIDADRVGIRLLVIATGDEASGGELPQRVAP